MTVPHRARHTALLRRGRGQLPSAGPRHRAQSRVRAGAERSADTDSRDTGDQGEENIMREQCSEKLNEVTHAVYGIYQKY